MRLMKFVLMMSLMLFAGVLSVSAQTTEREERSEPTSVFVVSRTQGKDCNNNGIDDLDEFFPPDCSGKLTTEGDDTRNYELDDWWLTVFDLQCPGGWTFNGNTGELTDCKQE